MFNQHKKQKGDKMKSKASYVGKVASWSTAFLLLSFSAASAKTFSKTEVKTFDISPDGKVVVDNVNGSVKVESWNNSQVMLEVTKTVKADDQEDAQQRFDRVKIEIDNQKDYLEIHTRYPGDEGWDGFWNWLFHGWSQNADVNYTLKVPASIHLEAGSTNGNVEVHSVAGGVKAYSTNGNVEVDSASGGVEASSTNGRLDLNDVAGNVDGSTTNGGVNATISNGQNLQKVSLTTTNGSIKVYCTGDLNADVSAHTTNGSVHTDFPVTIKGDFDHKSFEGKINKGGAPIHLNTTNGSIEIKQR